MVQKQKSSRQGSFVSGDLDVPIPSERAQRPQKSVVGSAELTDTFFGGGSDDDEVAGGEFGDDDFDDDDDDETTGADYFKDDKDTRKKGEEDDDTEFTKFYHEMSAAGAAKSAKRKDRYVVTPRVPGEHLAEMDPSAKRAASYQIIKNRGLVASKAKINRNPRVKKKEQFRKATIARKGQVRDIRDSREGAMYGGEATGIKANISRSRKIVN
jgi:U3 small nucleolar RNA-associated protein 3